MSENRTSTVVLITGASSGIGLATAQFLVQKGYRVIGTSRNPSGQDLGFPLLKMDVGDQDTIGNAVAKVIEEYGALDVLVNNVGVGITGPVEETPDREIQKAFDTNYFGPLRVIKAVLPHMRVQKSGKIINITSIAGYMGLPFRGIYSASKAALEVTTEALRMELKDFNIRVSNIAPGDFATNIAAGRYHAPVQKDSPYLKRYSATLDLMNAHVDSGGDPVEVARKVFQVLQQQEPDIHYKVGQPLQKISIMLKAVLPDKMYERLLLKHYKL